MDTANFNNLDVFIVGGGVHGTAIAAQASELGLKTLLCEQQDIPPGNNYRGEQILGEDLRDLEGLGLRQIITSLSERKKVRHKAAHLCQPLKIHLITEHKNEFSLRLKLGLAFYHFIARKDAQSIGQHWNKLKSPKSQYPYAQSPYCYENIIDDHGLVVENALTAKQKGAEILCHEKVISAQRLNHQWHIQTVHNQTRKQRSFTSQSLINATGPSADDFLRHALNIESRCQLRRQRNLYVVLPKFYRGQHGYWLEYQRNNVLSIIPHQDNWLIAGPVNCNFENPLCSNENQIKEQISVSETEDFDVEPDKQKALNQIIKILNQYFKLSLEPRHIEETILVSNLMFDPNHSSVTDLSREHILDFNCPDGRSPLISVFGGRIANYRLAAEQSMSLLSPFINAQTRLPALDTNKPRGLSNEINEQELAILQQQAEERYSWLSQQLFKRYLNLYGRRIDGLLSQCDSTSDLGVHFGAGLYEKEVDFLIEEEWANSTEKILLRTHLGRQRNKIDTNNLAAFIKNKSQGDPYNQRPSP